MNTLSDEGKRPHSIKLIEQGLNQAKQIYTEQQNISSTKINDETCLLLLQSLQENEVFKVYATIESNRCDVERRKRN